MKKHVFVLLAFATGLVVSVTSYTSAFEEDIKDVSIVSVYDVGFDVDAVAFHFDSFTYTDATMVHSGLATVEPAVTGSVIGGYPTKVVPVANSPPVPVPGCT